MSDFQEADRIRELIDQELANRNLSEQPRELYDPIDYILSNGGKRARPVLVMMACGLFTDEPDISLPAALAVEIFHNFTLVHDDIMDNAPLRRNKPTVHEKWGDNVAILSGDAMMVKAYEQLLKCDPHYLAKVLAIFNSAALNVCEGQQMDMNFQEAKDVTIEEYVRMIELKTSTLLAASLKLGAILGGAADEQADLLWSFGRNIGIAFQLQDDILDVYGEEGKFGKLVGGDIVAGKKTFLLLKALEMGGDEVERALSSWVTDVQADTQVQVSGTREIFDDLNVKELAQEEVKKYHNEGMACLEALDVDASRKAPIKYIAETLLNREI
ncbi:MAG: polyprenyl synthetase family protein [Flavobacteriales bacterium]|nr:polyprenyl synthetase family protein [Flavobacteriales bacterium]